jgi:phosphosulfolactate synthase
MLLISSDEMLEDIIKDRIDSRKPRQEGITYMIDRLHSIDKEGFETLSPIVDIVKIYGAYPLLIPNAILEKKIRIYHKYNVLVSLGSTMTEYAIMENVFERFISEAARIGFDVIEISENHRDLSLEEKEAVVKTIESKDLRYFWKIGRKDPRHQLTIEQILSRTEECMRLGSNKVILEANEGIGVGIYDERGSVKWHLMGALTSKFPPKAFIFEAPLESQQSALIAEFGQRVNLAEVRPDLLMSVETQRRGLLSKATYGVSYFRKEPEGGPASKFIYYIIKTKYPVEQSELIRISHLPRRTIQNAIEDLKEQGLILEKNSLDDTRRKAYYPVVSEWL